MEFTTIIGILVALIGVGAGIVQILDYVEKRRKKEQRFS